MASPLEGDDIYGSFHRDQFQRTQDLQNQVSALSDRLDQITAHHQKNHQSVTAIGIDATESVTRLGSEVERLKVKIENDKTGRDVEKLQTDLNALAAKIDTAELDQKRMEQMESRIEEIGTGFDLSEIRNHEWQESISKEFADIPKITPYYKKLLQEGRDLGSVLQHLSDTQDGQDVRISGTESRVGNLAKTVDAGFKENKQQLGGIREYFTGGNEIDGRTQDKQARLQEHLEGLKRNQLFLGVGLGVVTAVGAGIVGWKLITGWLKRRREGQKIFGGASPVDSKMPEMQQIGHGIIKRRSHARDWEVEEIARN